MFLQCAILLAPTKTLIYVSDIRGDALGGINGWITLWMCWLKGGSKPDRTIHPFCLRHILLVSSLFLFKQTDYSKESSTGRREGLWNLSRGIKGERCTSNAAAADPPCGKLVFGVRKLATWSAAAPQLYHTLTQHLKGTEFTPLWVRAAHLEREKLNESHKEDLNSDPRFQIEAQRHEESGIQIRNEVRCLES